MFGPVPLLALSDAVAPSGADLLNKAPSTSQSGLLIICATIKLVMVDLIQTVLSSRSGHVKNFVRLATLINDHARCHQIGYHRTKI